MHLVQLNVNPPSRDRPCFALWVRLRAAASACMLATLVGCSARTATVSGRVTFNGEPVARGAITLVPSDGKGSTAGGPIEAGGYVIHGVLPGEKTVQLVAIYSMGRKKEDDGSEVEAMGDLLPASWGPASKERMTVTAPKTEKDFAITGPDPRKK